MSAVKSKFEGMFIIDASMSDDAKNACLEEVKAEITKNDGQILSEKVIGRKKLAYEINKRKDGFYALYQFDLPGDAVSKIKRVYQISDKVLKCLIVRIEENQEAPVLAEAKS